MQESRERTRPTYQCSTYPASSRLYNRNTLSAHARRRTRAALCREETRKGLHYLAIPLKIGAGHDLFPSLALLQP